jgi:hypothetical protein
MIFASDSEQGDEPGLFTQGTWKVDLYNPLKFQFGTYGIDGEKEYNWTDLKFKSAADYFFLDHFGAGIKFSYDREVETYPDDDVDKWSELSVDLSLLYGNSFGGFNLYVKPFVGFGTEVYKYEYTGGSDEDKYGLIRTGVEVGSPFPIGANGHITLNPYVKFQYRKYTYKEVTSDIYTDTKFYAGARLSVFLGCEDMLCDLKTNFENATDRFAQGRNVIEAYSKIRLYQQNFKESWEAVGETQEDKDRERGFHIGLNYKRALFDGLLVGGRLSVFAESYDYLEDETYIQKSSGFKFGPVVEYHPFDQPVLGNLFVEGGASFGAEKNSYEQPSGEDEFKFSVVMVDLSVGFDLGLSEYWSLVSRIGFETEVNKASDEDTKANTTNGIFAVGLRHSF